MQTINETDDRSVEEIESTGETLVKVRSAIGEVIFGQEPVIDQALIAILSGGHALLVGVPGLAKTKLVETIARVLGTGRKAHPVYP